MIALPNNVALQGILQALPKRGETSVDWEKLAQTALGELLAAMGRTPQNPLYHGEGDVLAHTKLVCRAMLTEPAYREATDTEQCVLLLAALLHDIGKIRCTRMQDGAWVSPYHARTGAKMARAFLWKTCGLCGTQVAQALRESICALIRYHAFPPFAMEARDGERRLLRIAETGLVAPYFSIKHLCLLERADVLGRIAADEEDYLMRVEYCREMAEELSCATVPYSWSDAHSRRAYFSGQLSHPTACLYDDTWGEVILLSGLPGTGKDTWIKRNCPDLPVISLDEIRLRIGVSPNEPQGEVIAVAQAEARALLRDRHPFVWNATNITADLRGKLIALFEQYGASVRIVFLETAYGEQLRRNAGRDAVVPTDVIDRMLAKLEPPEPHECRTVVWELT